ncbi:hypothetical protein MMC18_006147 [Xylographa bjoerkii]|nr:hypothetical protein [Xylographa bjoerkii]
MPPARPAPRPPVAHHPLIERFIVIKQLTVTEGCFNAGIFKVNDLSRKNVCIEKRFKAKDILNGIFDTEASLLRRCQHRNVVEYIHAFVEDAGFKSTASIYMELCDLGSLNDLMERYAREERGFCEEFVWSVFRQMANALGYIQYGITEVTSGQERRNPNWAMIVHRDVFPKNVCLKNRPGEFPRLALADFGVSEEIPVGQEGWENGIGRGRHKFGNHLRAPPEATVLEGPDWGAQSDIYLVGQMIHIICSLPFPALRHGYHMDRGRMRLSDCYSVQLRDARDAFLREDWRARPRIMTIAPRLPILEREALAAYREVIR